MKHSPLYIWKRSPFLRLLVPFLCGICMGRFCPLTVLMLWAILATGVSGMVVYQLSAAYLKFRFAWVTGLMVNIMLAALGSMLVFYGDEGKRADCFVKLLSGDEMVLVRIVEPLSEKPKSYKSTGQAELVLRGGVSKRVSGKMILYFQKDSSVMRIRYGDRMLLKGEIVPVSSAINPAGFDYGKYAYFQGVFGQVYLKAGQYAVIGREELSRLDRLLTVIREYVLGVLKKYIPGKKESGLAEALLVGYKDDLDRELVQAYSNTGVLHVIAISGLHLGLVYWLLNRLLMLLSGGLGRKWMIALIVIAGLWLFALLAGAGPSVLRSAVMLTFVICGENFFRRVPVYNSLAASAFLLLCIHPYWLWDVGFQLSYAAVLSIVIFLKPVYHLLYVRNKLLDFLWQLNAMTIAAQLLTVPLCVYHFHQFPVYFILTNLVAVPLSSIILIGEIALCAAGLIPAIAGKTGLLLAWLIRMMNDFVIHVDSLVFATWSGLVIDFPQTVLLYLFVLGITRWIIEMNCRWLWMTLVCLLFFFGIRTYSFIQAGNQEMLIVYNIPRTHAVDFISGRHCISFGTGDRQKSRALFRVADTTAGNWGDNGVFTSGGLSVLRPVRAAGFGVGPVQGKIDILILTGNIKTDVCGFAAAFDVRWVVADATNSMKNIGKWKRDCLECGVKFHAVAEKGAFVMQAD